MKTNCKNSFRIRHRLTHYITSHDAGIGQLDEHSDQRVLLGSRT